MTIAMNAFACRLGLLFRTMLAVAASLPAASQIAVGQAASIWTVPEVGALPQDTHGQLVRRGRDLITATYAYLGPQLPDAAKRYAGNNLACTNCHLSAGTRKYALPLFGLYGDFPQYDARAGAQITLEDRDGTLRVAIQDDGVGGADPTRGSGLTGLRDRVEALGGRLEVGSAPGTGTLLVAEIPNR